jgi:PAS domain S-box-containing protein
VLTFVDITDLKRAEQRITRLAALVESSREAIIGAAFDGEITSWNAGAQRLLGYSAAEAIGRSVAMLVPPDEPNALEIFHDAAKKRQPIDPIETVRRRKDGTMVHVLVMVSPVIDESGDVSGMVQIVHDITERQQRDEERATLLEQPSSSWCSPTPAPKPWGSALREAPSSCPALRADPDDEDEPSVQEGIYKAVAGARSLA